MENEKQKDERAIWEKANFVSRLSFHWLNPIVMKAWRSEVSAPDLYPVSQRQGFMTNKARWLQHIYTTGPKMWFFRIYWREILGGLMVSLGSYAMQLFIMYWVFQMLAIYLTDPTLPFWWGMVLCVVMLAASITQNFLMAQSWVAASNLGLKAKSGFLAIAFDKATRMKVLSEEDNGYLMSVMTIDAEKVFEIGLYGLFAIAGPFYIISAVVLLCVLLGWPAVPSFGLVVLAFVGMRYAGFKQGQLRRQIIGITEKRINLIAEMVGAAKVCKMYNFERSLGDQIVSVREEEVRKVTQVGLLSGVTAVTVQSWAILAPLVLFLIYLGIGNRLTSAQAFTALSLINSIWFPLQMMGFSLTRYAVGLQSMARLHGLLQREELDPNAINWIRETNDPGIVFEDSAFAYSKSPSTSANNVPFQLSVPGKMEVKQGEIAMVCGAVGSGKTTLLLGLLGQLNRVHGSVTIRGSVAYASQTAFIVNSTLRENVLFGKAFEEERYRACLAAACLDVDVAGFRDGDMTEIGEKGINLSGGQKQRVSVARALYADTDILLLDDVLSAVDTKVGRRMFNNLIEMFRKKPKCVLFVNHQLQYASMCDRIFVLADQKIAEQGSFEELRRMGGRFERMLEDYVAEEEQQDEQPKLLPTVDQGAEKPDAGKDAASTSEKPFQFVKSEQASNANVRSSVWREYFRRLGALFFTGVCIITFYQGVRAFTDFWLALYLQQSLSVSFPVWGGVYGMLAGVCLIIFLCFEFSLWFSTLRASKSLHNHVALNILRATMAFFDSTPIGRIMNRFSKDIDTMDYPLPFSTEQALIYMLQSISVFVAIAVVYPILLVCFPPVFVIFVIIAMLLRNSMRQTRRIVGVQKSFVLSVISTFMNGMQTIRAFGATSRFQDEMTMRCDNEQAVMWVNLLLGRWFNLRLDIVVSFLVFIVSIVSVNLRSASNSALGALAISYTVRLASAFQWSIRSLVEIEAHITSVERLLEYVEDLPMEPSKGLVAAPEGWPSSSSIEFDHVTVRYRPDAPPVLNDVSFFLPSGTSLGVVGRTGAGKSTLVACLLRLIPYEGTIRLDGVDISTISLEELRGSISVIPQESVIFSGTLRKNLDPKQASTDEEIYDVLSSVNLRDMKLDEPVEDLSQGEKQLLCIARAFLHKGRVLISDESTSSVDTANDRLLQVRIERYLRSSRMTSITIAHRLQTVVGCDLVLVLDKGRVIELGPPGFLVNKGKSFLSLVLETGPQSSQHLISLASKKLDFEQKLDEDHSEWYMNTDFELFSVPL